MSPANRFLLKGTIVLVIACGLAAFASFEVAESLWRKDCSELRSVWDRWNEAGKPKDEKLIEFMRGRNPRLLVSSQKFEFDGVTYQGQFEFQSLSSGKGGVLFITTDKKLYWLKKDGEINEVKGYDSNSH